MRSRQEEKRTVRKEVGGGGRGEVEGSLGDKG